ncbi:hypothetical protein CLU79DRAFT_753956 [Phycomyces nitens]|nr:hypothetical protein CLU79DRAFT_753956 [Phycomyces nitens]
MAQHSFQLVTILASISTVITSVQASPIWVANNDHKQLKKRAEPSEVSATSSKHAEPTHSKAETSSAAVKHTSAPKESPKESAHATTTTKKSASHKASSTVSSKAHANATNSAIGSGLAVATAAGSAAPTSTGVGAITNAAQSESASSGMSSGAVGGIIAGVCVAVVGALAFVMVRRKRRARGVAAQPIPAMETYNNEPETESLGIFTVVTTYMPTLSDELEIQPGDRVNMLMEFDDGWCRGINLSRGNELGVFPRYCVEQISTPQSAPKAFNEKETDRTKRVSSMYMG